MNLKNGLGVSSSRRLPRRSGFGEFTVGRSNRAKDLVDQS